MKFHKATLVGLTNTSSSLASPGEINANRITVGDVRLIDSAVQFYDSDDGSFKSILSPRGNNAYLVTSSIQNFPLEVSRSAAEFGFGEGGGGDIDSAVITASAVGDTITFVKGDLSTFDVRVISSGSVETASVAESLFHSVSSGQGILNFTFDGTEDVVVTLDTSSTHFLDPIDNAVDVLSGSASTSRDAIASDITALSSSASTSRNAIVANISGAFVPTDTSSLLENASTSNNDITFTRGDGSTFTVTVDTGSGGGGTPTDTGSLLTTASAEDNVVTFTKGDSTTFQITIDTGSGEPLPDGVISGSAQITRFGFVSQSSNIVDLPGVKIQYSNVYNNLSDLPNASSYHGMFAHVHSTGKAYYAHAGNWIELANNVNLISSSAQIQSLGFVQNSQTSSFLTSADTGSFVLSSETSSFVTNNQTSSFVTNSQTSSFVNNDQTGSFITVDQTSSFLTSEDTGSFVLDTETGSFVTNNQTGSFLTAADTGSLIRSDQTSSMTVLSASYAISSSHEVRHEVSSSYAETASFAFTASHAEFSDVATSASYADTSSHTPFDGNKVVSNVDLGDLFTNNFNAGTSGSISDFLNAVFFPNSAPSFTSGTNFNTAEFGATGSTVTTLTATDPESQALTFSTQSSYTDGYVNVASNGIVTLAVVPTVTLFNTTNRGDGVLAHPVPVEVEDTIGSKATTTIYIRVDANQPPVFRQTSVSGPVITSFSQSRNENASTGSVARLYFTDPESDAITIQSQSDSTGVWSLTKYSTYVELEQITASLDYENTQSYSLSLTASDEHYESGQDTASIAFLPITINVTDNVHPTVNDQTLPSINENSADGTTVGTITANDTEGDTINFFDFALSSLELNGNPIATGSYTGTGLTNPNENPFQMNSSGTVTRKNGVYLNSDLIDAYKYSVKVSDTFNTSSDAGIITIPISDYIGGTITDNWNNLYIIESATTGDEIRADQPNGRTGTAAQWSATTTQRWSVDSDPNLIVLNSTGSTRTLVLTSDISGSAYSAGDTIEVSLTASEDIFFTTKQRIDATVNIVANFPPTSSFIDQTSVQNENQATAGTNMVTVGLTDPESDVPYSATIAGADGPSFSLVPQNADTSSLFVEPTASLSAGTYNIAISASDSFGKQSITAHSFTIAGADDGTLGGDLTNYIIESAVSGAVLRDQTGYNAGNPSVLSVSYSPNYGSQLVQSYTSSNAAIAVDTSGNLTLAINLSGSTTGSGDVINSNITFRDQYNNIGSGSITVNVFANSVPTLSFTDNTSQWETNNAQEGVALVSMSISDVEGDTPYSASIGGADKEFLVLKPTNANSSSYGINAVSALSASTINYSITASDSFGKVTQEARTITITQSPDYGRILIYNVAGLRLGGLSGNYNGTVGINTLDTSVTPYRVTGVLGFSPFSVFTGSLGTGSANIGSGTITKVAEITGSSDYRTPDTILRELGTFAAASVQEQIMILIPSGSDLNAVPTRMRDSYGGSLDNEFVMNVNTDNSGWTNTIEGSNIHHLPLSQSYEGFSDWFVIGRTTTNTGTSTFEVRLTPSSGSAPTD